jgi:hypothetical protein
MRRYRLIMILVAMFVVATASAQTPQVWRDHVFFIRSFDRNAGWELRATGFRIRDRENQTRMVTALHVVAGADRITASSASKEFLDDLVIQKVDVERDLAMLDSALFDQGKPGAFGVAWEANLEDLADKEVLAIGYPYGGLHMEEIDTRLRVRNKPLMPLEALIDDEARKKLIQWDSPSLATRVLSLQGPLLPGYSGAPIVDQTGRAVAVGLGGLDGGHGGLVWASPLADAVWRPASGFEVQGKLKRLKLRSLQDSLFALGPVLQPAREDAGGPFETEIVEFMASPNPLPRRDDMITFYVQVREQGTQTAATGAVDFYYVGTSEPKALDPGQDPKDVYQKVSDAALFSGVGQSYRARFDYDPGKHYFIAAYRPDPDDKRFRPSISRRPLLHVVR